MQLFSKHLPSPLSTISRSIGKSIALADDVSKGILAGVNALTDVVQVTFGPKGRNIIIQSDWGEPRITKDGVTVAKAVELEPGLPSMGASLIKTVASKTNDEAGDGTTTATILARAILSEGFRAVGSGANPVLVSKGIKKATDKVLSFIESKSEKIKIRDLEKVTSVSSNDSHIGKLVADVISKVEEDGIVTIEQSNTLNDEVVMVEGMQIDRGYLSPYFINSSNGTVEFENPLILLIDGDLNDPHPLLPILKKSIESHRPLLIIANDVTGNALSTLIINKLRSGLDVCSIKAPSYGDNRRNYLLDIAAECGGLVVDKEGGLMGEIDPKVLGSSNKVIVRKNETILIGGKGDKKECEKRMKEIQLQLDNTKNDLTDNEKEILQKRLAKLKGHVAMIRVGGGSEAEVKERKDRFEDSMNAAKAALAEGVLPGGGVSLLRAASCLEQLERETTNIDERAGIGSVRRALQIPTKTIVNNSGGDGSVVCSKLLGAGDFWYGYDVTKEMFMDMKHAGIVDPLKVVRCALRDASSVASLLVSTSGAIFEKSIKKSKVEDEE